MNSSSSTRSVVPNSFQPHGRQPAKLLHPWDFPGKNTGVGCHFLLQGIFQNQGSNPCLLCLLPQKVYSLPLAPPGKPFIMNAYVQMVSVTQPFLTLCDPMDCSPPGFFVHVILQARIAVGCHSLLQGIFLAQGSNSWVSHIDSEPPWKLLSMNKLFLLFETIVCLVPQRSAPQLWKLTYVY